MDNQLNEFIEVARQKLTAQRKHAEEERIKFERQKTEEEIATKNNAIKLVIDAMKVPEFLHGNLNCTEHKYGEYGHDYCVQIDLPGFAPVWTVVRSDWEGLRNKPEQMDWVIAEYIKIAYSDEPFVKTCFDERRDNLSSTKDLALALALAEENWKEREKLKAECEAEIAERAKWKVPQPKTETQEPSLADQLVCVLNAIIDARTV